jgi:MoaA/NifB/PqqE/SkfB family radical SAM enzyme
MFRKYILNFRYAFRPRKPLLFLRLVITYLGIIFLRRKPLRYVDLAIGYACNLKCEHCFATALEKKGRRKITPTEYSVIVKQAMDLGAVNFSFQGGEPTMYSELLDFIKNTFPQRNLISVTTNATLLNEEKIKTFKKAGVDILTISLDSAVPEEHDKFRGVKGTFEKTMNTINIALKNGLNVTLGGVVSHQNIRSKGLIDLIELAHRLNIIIFLALATPIGEWENNEDIILTDDDRKYLFALVKKYPLLRTDFEANFAQWGCGAIKEILYITPYGDVLPCPFIHCSVGNVFEDNLKDIRDKALQNPYFDHYHHLCLAAEDREFMKKNVGTFYFKDNNIRKLT